jgi:hemolysin III
VEAAPDLRFPSYTAAEAAADRVVHLVGLPAAIAATAWLIASTGPAATVKQTATLLTYGFGLIGMLAASAAYNFARPGRAKALLRRIDHAMIFVMIAGSYTPFALNALRSRLGIPLCAAVWGLAAVGVLLKLACYQRVARVSLALYLGMGWLLLVVIRPLVAALPGEVLALLLAGGIVYSVGSLVHVRDRLPFHNAIWHAMVLVAAGLHLAAVARLLMLAA